MQSDKVYLEQQKAFTLGIINELEHDYTFAVENIEGDQLECPLCGTFHENSVVNKASILTDKQQAENQLTTINDNLLDVMKDIQDLESRLAAARKEITELNEKFSIKSEDSNSLSLLSVIERIAGNSIREHVIEDRGSKVLETEKLSADDKDLAQQQKNLIDKQYKDSILDSFNSTFQEYINLLDAEAVNISMINSPLDYVKVIKEGGAAEGSRAILAYYLSIFSLVEELENEVKAGLIIDTPNQQEQSKVNYSKIVNILSTKIGKDSQVILCAMDNSQLNPFRSKARVIELKKSNRILRKDMFEEVSKYFT